MRRYVRRVRRELIEIRSLTQQALDDLEGVEARVGDFESWLDRIENEDGAPPRRAVVIRCCNRLHIPV